MTCFRAPRRASAPQGKPWSFLHISKPEIDLDPKTDPYDRAVYAKAAENLERMIEAGVLMRDAAPCYYVYRLTWRDRVQTGLAAVASVADYETNRIRKHEFTTPDKEDDRVRQIEAVNAQTGPVMIAYPDAPAIDAMLAEAALNKADVDVTADDGVRHQMWVVDDEALIARPHRAFDAMPALYIADGHHRSAAASRVARLRGGDTGAHGYFLAVIFPHHQMTILDYNRVVKDLNGLAPNELPARWRALLRAPATAGRPARRASSACSLRPVVSPGGSIRPMLVPQRRSDGRLEVSLLPRHVLEPLLGITDQRRDKRIDFVGGIRGLASWNTRRTGEMAVAFALYPTQMSDLMAVADAGLMMPPKSTWFEPKLADGLVNHVLD